MYSRSDSLPCLPGPPGDTGIKAREGPTILKILNSLFHKIMQKNRLLKSITFISKIELVKALDVF